MGRRKEALTLPQTVATNPLFRSEQNLVNNLGVIHQRTGNFDQARQCLQTAIELQGSQGNPAQEFGLNFNMGVTLLKADQLTGALEHFLKARKIIEAKIQNLEPSELSQFGFDIR